MKNGLLLIIMATASIFVIGCSGDSSTPAKPVSQIVVTKAPVVKPIPTKNVPEVAATGDPISQGRDIFMGIGGCGACHKIDGIPAAMGMLGPELTHIGTDASDRKPGMSAKEYIFESIRDPEAFVADEVERAVPNIMTAAITVGLSDPEVNALVEFLLVQE